MSLVASFKASPTGHHHGMWRHPDTANPFLEPETFENVARILEAGRFDCVFFADALGLHDLYNGYQGFLETAGAFCALEPIQVLGIMARVTKHLGVGATLSTTHIPTYLLARQLATLDMLSRGRAAWNVVTSSTVCEARNFGQDGVDPRQARYDRADEVLEACDRLWSSWEEGAIVNDKQIGRIIDASKVHAADYEGRWIRTKGPLSVPHTPQGRPVIMQAGASDRGRDFAARWAEMIFCQLPDQSMMKALYDDVKGRMVGMGRRREDCAILMAIDVIAGETESIARDKAVYLDDLVTPEQGFGRIAAHVGFDPCQYPLDEPIVDMDIEEGSRGILDKLVKTSRDQGLTLRQAAKRYATDAFQPRLIGTPAQIADGLQHYFESACCDGFIIAPLTMPGTFEQMTRMVVPELQRRGLFRIDYRHDTLRQTVLTGE